MGKKRGRKKEGKYGGGKKEDEKKEGKKEGGKKEGKKEGGKKEGKKEGGKKEGKKEGGKKEGKKEGGKKKEKKDGKMDRFLAKSGILHDPLHKGEAIFPGHLYVRKYDIDRGILQLVLCLRDGIYSLNLLDPQPFEIYFLKKHLHEHLLIVHNKERMVM